MNQVSEPDYGKIVANIEAGTVDRLIDTPHIMALLGYEAMPHRRLGIACRLPGEAHWQACPKFDSTDDFEVWVLDKMLGELCDAGRDKESGEHYVSYQDAQHGNDYGQSKRLGAAMWAAFVKLAGEVDDEQDSMA